MKRDRIAKIATAAVVLGLLGFIVIHRTRPAPEPAPRDAIYQMLETARTGNTAAYLDHYTGQMRSTLSQAIAEKGEQGFKRYLQSSNSEIKGLAVFEPKRVSENEVALRVEYVYQDRNEAQIFYLEKSGNAWKIAHIDNAERVKTVVPYGTPVQ
ncbi:MAG: hypothetical protein ACR2NN_17575 [Bryobacteraceae bacterium]